MESGRRFEPPQFVGVSPDGPVKSVPLDSGAPDLWGRRAQAMTCASCMWWLRKGDGALGRCRRHAPTMAGFPATFDADWCGDHKLDEAAA